MKLVIGERGQGPSEVLEWLREDRGLLEWACGGLVYRTGVRQVGCRNHMQGGQGNGSMEKLSSGCSVSR